MTFRMLSGSPHTPYPEHQGKSMFSPASVSQRIKNPEDISVLDTLTWVTHLQKPLPPEHGEPKMADERAYLLSLR